MKLKNILTTAAVAAFSVGLVGCGTYSHQAAFEKNDEKVALTAMPAMEVAEQSAPATQIVASTFNFDLNKASLKDDNNLMLDEYADYLAAHPDAKVRIEGYADNRGKSSYNLALGMRRAQSISDYLEAKGVARDNIEVYSYGAENPVDNNLSEEAFARNRRAEVYFNMESSIS